MIEDYPPIEAITAEKSREKSVRKQQTSTLRLWWARRPLIACRAAVYGALVPADRWVRDVNLKNPPDDAKKATKVKNGKKKGRGTESFSEPVPAADPCGAAAASRRPCATANSVPGRSFLGRRTDDRLICSHNGGLRYPRVNKRHPTVPGTNSQDRRLFL